MELFRRYLGPSTEVDENSGADVVETLVDRLQTSTRGEDRRDAMRALRGLSKRYRLEVGTQAMPACIEALSKDSEDPDTVCYALNILCNIMNDDEKDLAPEDLVNIPPDLGNQFTEIFIKEPENVLLVLSFLNSHDMHLRRLTIQLLILMLKNKRKAVQDILLYSPMAVSRFIDTLSDHMEVIRNDGLLLLLNFTKAHPTIQKIVAFENVFDRTLGIVESETINEGGIVIEDCFSLLHQLLVGNKQNQMLFKDGRFIQRLAKIFEEIPSELTESCLWSAQKLVNVSWLLKIFRSLVAPSNKALHIRACQADMQSCGLLDNLWRVVMANGVPAELLMQTLHTIGEVVRGCPANQASLVSLVAPSDPPQPAIAVLLVTMVNERQQLAVRIAVLYAFQCLLAFNPEIQEQVVSTLLPRVSEPCSTSAGQLLCGGLFSQDPVTAWFSAVALLHSVHGNQALKESLLQVHMAPTVGGDPVTLMQQCFRLISQGSRLQGKIGLLQLFCVWLSHCPSSVHAFLSLRTNGQDALSASKSLGAGLSHLIADVSIGGDMAVGSTAVEEQAEVVSSLSALLIGICVTYNNGQIQGYDSDSLIKIVDKRIGIDDLVKRIGHISRTEAFIRTIKQSEPKASRSSDLIFDYEFTQIFKTVEFEVLARFSRPDASHQLQQQQIAEQEAQKEAALRNQQNVETLAAYQKAITDRDQALQHLQLRVIELERQLASTNQHESQPISSQKCPDVSELQHALAQTTERLRTAGNVIAELEMRLLALETEKTALRAEHEDLLLLLSEQDNQLTELTKSQPNQHEGVVEAGLHAAPVAESTVKDHHQEAAHFLIPPTTLPTEVEQMSQASGFSTPQTPFFALSTCPDADEDRLNSVNPSPIKFPLNPGVLPNQSQQYTVATSSSSLHHSGEHVTLSFN